METKRITSKVPENKCNESPNIVRQKSTSFDQKCENKSSLMENNTQKQNPDSSKKSDKIITANREPNKQGRRNSKRISKMLNDTSTVSVQEADSENTPKRVKQLQLKQLRQKYIRLSRVLQTKHSHRTNKTNLTSINKVKSTATTTLQMKIPGDEYSSVSNQIECATVPSTISLVREDEEVDDDNHSTKSVERFQLKEPEQPDSTIHVIEDQPINKMEFKSTLALLHINNTIITVEENTISFWICPSLIYTTFNGDSSWKLVGNIDRCSIGE